MGRRVKKIDEIFDYIHLSDHTIKDEIRRVFIDNLDVILDCGFDQLREVVSEVIEEIEDESGDDFYD